MRLGTKLALVHVSLQGQGVERSVKMTGLFGRLYLLNSEYKHGGWFVQLFIELVNSQTTSSFDVIMTNPRCNINLAVKPIKILKNQVSEQKQGFDPLRRRDRYQVVWINLWKVESSSIKLVLKGRPKKCIFPTRWWDRHGKTKFLKKVQRK